MYDDNRQRWNSNATHACANSRYQALSLLLNRPGYKARVGYESHQWLARMRKNFQVENVLEF